MPLLDPQWVGALSNPSPVLHAQLTLADIPGMGQTSLLCNICLNMERLFNIKHDQRIKCYLDFIGISLADCANLLLISIILEIFII